MRTLIRTYGLVFSSAGTSSKNARFNVVLGVFKFFQDALGFLQPQFLKMLLAFAATWATPNAESPEPISNGFYIAGLMLVSAMFQTILLHQYFHICLVTSLRIKSAVTTAVYRKALTLSNDSRQSSTTGEIVNLMTVDAGRIAGIFSPVVAHSRAT